VFDFHHIYVFVNVVQHKSFSKAAEAIFLSQSTVSTHIQTLEKELKVKLFDRLGKDIVLTPAGEKLYFWALELLAVREKAINDINIHFSKMEGTIKVAASTVPAQYIVPSLIGKFQNKYPGVFFRVFQENSEKVAEKVSSGEMEVGFLGARFHDAKLGYVSIAKDNLVLITPNNYAIENNSMHIEDILNQNLIMRNPGSGTQRVLESALEDKGLSLKGAKIVSTFDSTEAVKQAVRYGLGVAIVSERAAGDYIESGYVKAYAISGLDLTRDFYLIYHKDRTLSPICEKFIEYLTRVFEKEHERHEKFKAAKDSNEQPF
jgi:DNA-binding transcriptional LysR family regulator